MLGLGHIGTVIEELKAVRCCEAARTTSALLLVAVVNSSGSYETKFLLV